MNDADYEPLDWYAEGGNTKQAILQLLDVLKKSIQTCKGKFFEFKIEVKEVE